MGAVGNKDRHVPVKKPRVLLAAMGSRSGKTLTSCALLEVLRRRGLDPAAFKCGPDYIDPMYHKAVTGAVSRNLDTFFSDGKDIEQLIASARGGCALIEGVMGIYDGADIKSLRGSCYETAQISGTPVILIADAGGTGKTIISQIKGILGDDTEGLVKGLIFNKISAGFYPLLKEALESELEEAGSDTAVLGFIPRTPELSLDSRHLGLVLPEEIRDFRERMAKAAGLIEETLEIDRILEIMDSAPDLAAGPAFSPVRTSENGPVLGVAYDRAFNFYYRENLEIFERKGVKIQYFSPLEDRAVPENVSGLLFGGGYPELYLKELSENRSMMRSVKDVLKKGIPSLAECGGFMYLHKGITDASGTRYRMVGAADGECRYTGHLVRFGYMELTGTSLRDELYRSFIGMKGHEFHYYDSTCSGSAFTAKKPFRNLQWDCMKAGNNSLWGFPHLYYGSCPAAVDRFIERMDRYRQYQVKGNGSS